jgi:hypothetical protein
MSTERFYTTGKALFWVFPVFFIAFSCIFSCSTVDPKVSRAIARRTVQAAADAGAQTSKCASKDYYEAERNLNMGEKWMMDKGISDYSDDYFSKAISYGEKAEEKALFCDK